MIVEMYVRVVDKVDPVNGDPIQYLQLPQSGDVVEIRKEGGGWGSEMVASLEHVIISVEVESLEKAIADFMAPEIYHPIDNPYPRRKAVKVNTEMFPQEFKNAFALKDKMAILAECNARKAEGKPFDFGPKSDSIYKISKDDSFDIYTAREPKPAIDKDKDKILTLSDPFEVG